MVNFLGDGLWHGFTQGLSATERLLRKCWSTAGQVVFIIRVSFQFPELVHSEVITPIY